MRLIQELRTFRDWMMEMNLESRTQHVFSDLISKGATSVVNLEVGEAYHVEKAFTLMGLRVKVIELKGVAHTQYDVRAEL